MARDIEWAKELITNSVFVEAELIYLHGGSLTKDQMTDFLDVTCKFEELCKGSTVLIKSISSQKDFQKSFGYIKREVLKLADNPRPQGKPSMSKELLLPLLFILREFHKKRTSKDEVGEFIGLAGPLNLMFEKYKSLFTQPLPGVPQLVYSDLNLPTNKTLYWEKELLGYLRKKLSLKKLNVSNYLYDNEIAVLLGDDRKWSGILDFKYSTNFYQAIKLIEAKELELGSPLDLVSQEAILNSCSLYSE